MNGNRLSYDIYTRGRVHLSGELARVADPVPVMWLKDRLADCTVIDVREPDEYTLTSILDLIFFCDRYANGHIPGAHSFPLGLIARDVDNPQSPLRLLHSRLGATTPFVLYCKSGYRSQLAQDEFVLAGLDGAVSLDGGYRDWAEQVKTKI